MIGYVLGAPDNGSFMLVEDSLAPRCSSCGLVADLGWINPRFDLRDKRFDASYTYDGYLIVSERFRVVADAAGGRYIELPSIPGFYSLVVDRVVPFDSARRGTIFERPCEECGRFYVVAGATPAFLLVDGPLSDDFFRTDVEFGTGDEQTSLIALGAELAATLRAADLAGVDLEEIRE
jgi:hypothetical protein